MKTWLKVGGVVIVLAVVGWMGAQGVKGRQSPLPTPAKTMADLVLNDIDVVRV